ncbi:MAG: hypothetical protein Q9166_000720 [cf. Caloplaca sp. 2 TL-2023]
MSLYRKTEAAEPTTNLWNDFIAVIARTRDYLTVEEIGSPLPQAELDAIDLQNNSEIFPTLVTSKEGIRSRASMRKKAEVLEKQVKAYELAAEKMKPDNTPMPPEDDAAKHGMSYIGQIMSLSRKEPIRYTNDHEDHLATTAEKLRAEFATLGAYVNRVEKKLRNLI